MTCDFCLTDHRWLWMFPAREFVLNSAAAGNYTVTAQEWAVCGDCKPFMDSADYHGAAERVLALNKTMDEQGIRNMTRLLMQNIDGPLIYVESDHLDLNLGAEIRIRRLGGVDEWTRGRVIL